MASSAAQGGTAAARPEGCASRSGRHGWYGSGPGRRLHQFRVHRHRSASGPGLSLWPPAYEPWQCSNSHGPQARVVTHAFLQSCFDEDRQCRRRHRQRSPAIISLLSPANSALLRPMIPLDSHTARPRGRFFQRRCQGRKKLHFELINHPKVHARFSSPLLPLTA